MLELRQLVTLIPEYLSIEAREEGQRTVPYVIADTKNTNVNNILRSRLLQKTKVMCLLLLVVTRFWVAQGMTIVSSDCVYFSQPSRSVVLISYCYRIIS